MIKIREDLWQTSLIENSGVNSCGYLLATPNGNVQFYFAPDESDFERIEGLGGITHQILSHRHEFDPSTLLIRENFGSLLCCDAIEQKAIIDVCPVDVVIEQPNSSIGGIDIQLTPGHTAGGLSCHYVSTSGEVYLFSGDTMIPVKGGWVTQFVQDDGGDPDLLKSSLLSLRDMAPNLVLSSASVGDDSVIVMEPLRWADRVEETAARDPIVG